MLHQVKSSFTLPVPHSEAKAMVEAFARQEKKRFYPLELQTFALGARFQDADPQTKRVIVMAMLAWLDQHSLRSAGCQDQSTWQRVWKMRETFLHMLQFKIPFQEKDVIAILNWSASQSRTPAYIYFSGVPQVIKVVGEYLKSNPLSAELHATIDQLARCIEAGSTSVEIRRWILHLKELMGETQISLPLVTGDRWADAALKELYSLNAKTKTAWAELLVHCSQATSALPSRRWLAAADEYIDTIENLNFFIKLSHWFPLVDQPQMASANATILKGLVWLCAKSEDPEIACVLAALASASYRQMPGSGGRAAKIGNACCWALANMPIREGMAQLTLLKDHVSDNRIRRRIEKILATADRRERNLSH